MIRPYYYILDAAGNIQATPSALVWGAWFETCNTRVVAREKVGGCEVSTVFLGLDHNYRGVGPPVLWETIVFGEPMNYEMERCAGGREQAEAMHAAMVERVRAVLAVQQ